MRKFMKPGELVLDAFVWTLSTAEACILLDTKRRLVARCKDVDYLQKLEPNF